MEPNIKNYPKLHMVQSIHLSGRVLFPSGHQKVEADGLLCLLWARSMVVVLELEETVFSVICVALYLVEPQAAGKAVVVDGVGDEQG